MDPQEPTARSDRDQMWSSLRDLLPEIERLAQGHFEGTERERQMVQLLARITVLELKLLAAGADPE